ncbi:hypothetical protein CC80DRAFT_504405 [Byssothecium circinans]|uniref:Uncharacterized protein n=1 Tax=Byssothecium circinans TaxID=147558 RepID=A0A6A5TV84_9PLEO|nr:hypothetical protein CC80DRAFT_504405 [Byssothecium circinans]
MECSVWAEDEGWYHGKIVITAENFGCNSGKLVEIEGSVPHSWTPLKTRAGVTKYALPPRWKTVEHDTTVLFYVRNYEILKKVTADPDKKVMAAGAEVLNVEKAGLKLGGRRCMLRMGRLLSLAPALH